VNGVEEGGEARAVAIWWDGRKSSSAHAYFGGAALIPAMHDSFSWYMAARGMFGWGGALEIRSSRV